MNKNLDTKCDPKCFKTRQTQQFCSHILVHIFDLNVGGEPKFRKHKCLSKIHPPNLGCESPPPQIWGCMDPQGLLRLIRTVTGTGATKGGFVQLKRARFLFRFPSVPLLNCLICRIVGHSPWIFDWIGVRGASKSIGLGRTLKMVVVVVGPSLISVSQAKLGDRQRGSAMEGVGEN